MRIAIQGTDGSFSEAAARRRWPGAMIVPCREASDVVTSVRSGGADAGCLPIENSLVGSVSTTYDLLETAFGDGTLVLTHETVYPVHHTLMGVPGARLADVRRVSSHPVALGQCRQWLGRHLPNVELVSAWDTAGAAELVACERNATLAAIAGRHAADVHGLVPLAERIEDDPTNQTRFLTFTRGNAPTAAAPQRDPAAPHKTSMIAVLDHRPGTLAHALDAFASRGVNLTSIQSRPERSAPWTYRFYIDVEGATTDRPIAEALAAIGEASAKLIVLGSYERSVQAESS